MIYDEPLTPMPTIASFVMEVLRRHGVNVLIMIYLIWQVTTSFTGEQRAMHTDLLEHIRLASMYSRQICINTATTDKQTQACEPERMTR